MRIHVRMVCLLIVVLTPQQWHAKETSRNRLRGCYQTPPMAPSHVNIVFFFFLAYLPGHISRPTFPDASKTPVGPPNLPRALGNQSALLRVLVPVILFWAKLLGSAGHGGSPTTGAEKAAVSHSAAFPPKAQPSLCAAQRISCFRLVCKDQ
ncbi:hypothetical protein DL89DRAFT_70541 [Linderina pennispora]|uniref:Secreted protein n=1 Tax=Linderina pennispora TaxID=61395 RepID=A0A1Y1VYN2_9FUNG|nr:uncharacterized protein DL89DRAFT_70541 [Linderina pennispora]ORX66373.1 hypothetical protein DL89DRAFT_70541 [Linderina pennispora]